VDLWGPSGVMFEAKSLGATADTNHHSLRPKSGISTHAITLHCNGTLSYTEMFSSGLLGSVERVCQGGHLVKNSKNMGKALNSMAKCLQIRPAFLVSSQALKHAFFVDKSNSSSRMP